MRTLAWITDPHFNFVNMQQWEAFADQIRACSAAALVVSGDISEADDVVWQLQRLQAEVGKPIYFVLGNHDFYHSRIEEVRASVSAHCQTLDGLYYLTGQAPVMLSHGWAICGDDGWADARVGDYWGSPVQMLDFRRIEDLAVAKPERLRRLRRLGAASAMRLRKQLEVARSSGVEKFLVVTHVPPFRESCWYEGRVADDLWAPFFINYSLGWMLKRFCSRFPELQVVVLCGHTHHAGSNTVLPNLKVYTGGATYGQPRLEAELQLDSLV